MTDREEAGREAQIAGELAETEFKRLAAEAGLVASKPVPDLCGWDFCVERPSVPSLGPLDLVPASPRWMVQVKSIQGPASTIRITLENWRKMVTEPIPWFVFVARVNERVVTAVYLLHVDERIITRVLKRLRVISAHKHARLNKSSLALSCRKEHQLHPIAGSTLLNALKAATGLDAAKYSRRKQRLVATVGYNGTHGLAHLEFEEQHLPLLADFVVGTRGTVPVKSLHIQDTRFDIPVTAVQRGPGVLAGPPSPSVAITTVTLTDNTGTHLTTLDFETRQARALVPDLPEQHDRLVLSRPHLRLIVRSGSANLKIEFDLSELSRAQPLAAFGAVCEFVAALVDSRWSTFRIEMRVHGAPAAPATLEFSHKIEMSPIQRAYIRAFADGAWLCRRVGVPASSRIAPEQFALQNMELSLLRAALSGEQVSWNGTVPGTLELSDGPTGVVFVRFVALGEFVFGAAVSCVGRAVVERETTSTKISVTDGRAAVEREVTLSHSAAAERRDLLNKEWSSQAEAWLLARGAVNLFM